ncbi:porin [Duganella sp. S19_KUP01_CR8]|uniref:porin n=1 Tax=Duganella sp. S19_KUP01_CR8 TaxID=3025502 RepID=UPI002FCDCBFC
MRILKNGPARVACLAGLAGIGAAPLPAQAVGADQLTLFGVFDTFATRLHADGLAPVVRLDASGLLASRIGLRGREELGGGWRSNFLLEAGLDGDVGAQPDGNRLFNRQAWVSLAGAPGEVRLGRQNTPQFYMNGKFDAFTSATQASGWNNLFGAPPRLDNAIGYLSPSWGGWTVQALAGRGATGGAAPSAELAANQSTHLAVEAVGEGWYWGANYQLVKNASLPYSARRDSTGGSWDAGHGWTLFGAAGRETRSDASQHIQLYSLSLRYRGAGPYSVSVGWAGLRDHLSGAGHGNADQLGALYLYLLSTRTTLYGALARLNQQGRRNSFALVGAAVVAPAAQLRSPQPGGDLQGLQLGILHTF